MLLRGYSQAGICQPFPPLAQGCRTAVGILLPLRAVELTHWSSREKEMKLIARQGVGADGGPGYQVAGRLQDVSLTGLAIEPEFELAIAAGGARHQLR